MCGQVVLLQAYDPHLILGQANLVVHRVPPLLEDLHAYLAQVMRIQWSDRGHETHWTKLDSKISSVLKNTVEVSHYRSGIQYPSIDQDSGRLGARMASNG